MLSYILIVACLLAVFRLVSLSAFFIILNSRVSQSTKLFFIFFSKEKGWEVGMKKLTKIEGG